MYSVASWNIRGLNWCPKQKEVLQVVNKNNLSVCAILESHVDVLAVYDTCKKVNIRVDNKTLFCSYVYADNYYVDRHALWNNLAGHAGLMRDKSWVLLDCVQRMEVIDVNSSGLHFTWNQKPKGSNGILKKIDMIIGNLQFNDDFSGSFAIFQPYRILDHSSCVLRIPKVVKRLKGLKSLFHKLLHTHGNLHDQVKMLRVELDEVQRAIDRDPSCQSLRDDHAHYLLAFKKASLDEERFLRQKSKKVDVMVRDITDSEIRGALFSMGDDKSPGPDGYTTAFFKKESGCYGRDITDSEIDAWNVVGSDVTCTIRDFFSNGKLLKEIIANRIKDDLGDLVSIKQSAFVSGRRISDNIMLTQELMWNYHKRSGPPRCAFKVDIQKAYDTVDWNFLKLVLVGCGFHQKMMEWIMVCVTSTSYSVCVNGNIHGWFNGKRGLRQGNHLSPYLFTLVIEVLTLILQQSVHNAEEFQYHDRCDHQRSVNLCFADDLFLFARGHPNSVQVIMHALEEFKNVSGLVPSILKSTAFFCNVPNALKATIMSSMPFVEGFPVLYCLYLTWVHVNTVMIDHVTEEMHFLQPELALGKLSIQSLLPQQLQHQLQMNLMILLSL
ncbi:putative RNA-directed DNA polymerase [Tanacetum coccineum]|uniref:RNA-directed DNA polymerase n=1 Tax=Tanacetum coccineum TaxID=301880 RepID=A0ABQ4WLZ5_9ASTR